MACLPCLQLRDGNEMPVLGYGLGPINMAHMAEHDEVVKRTVMAIRAGFHHLDGAEAYGNERALGEAVRASGVPREKLFVTAKFLGAAGQDVQAAFDTSMHKLGLDYVDLYLIHLPYRAPDEMPSMWAQMERIKESGRAKSIGVSNFLQPHLEAILSSAKVAPVVNQIEYHPYLQCGNLVDFCRGHHIAVVAHSTLTAITKAQPGPVDSSYKTLAAKYGADEVEVAFRWCLDQGMAVVTTSSNQARLDAYRANVARFHLSNDEIRMISDLGLTKHYRGLYNRKFGRAPCYSPSTKDLSNRGVKITLHPAIAVDASAEAQTGS